MIGQSVSLNLGLADSTIVWLAKKHQGSPESVSAEMGLLKHHPWLLCRCWEWNVGPHTCLWTLRLSHLLSTRDTFGTHPSIHMQGCSTVWWRQYFFTIVVMGVSATTRTTQEHPRQLDFRQYLRDKQLEKKKSLFGFVVGGFQPVVFGATAKQYSMVGTSDEHSHSHQQPEVRGKETGPQHFQWHIPVTFPLGPAFSTNTWAFERHWDLKYCCI